MSETAMDIDPQEGPSTEKSNTESKKTLGYEMPWYMLQPFIYLTNIKSFTLSPINLLTVCRQVDQNQICVNI